MLNLDFGTDWGSAAAYSFKNKNFVLGLLQEFNGMAEAAVDLGLAYFGAALLGATEAGLETAITSGSLTSGFIDGQKQFQNSTNNLLQNFVKVFKGFTSKVSDGYKATSGGGGITNSISINNKSVTFGHGGRHLSNTGLSIRKVEKKIAKDVCSKELSIGNQDPQYIKFKGHNIEYRAYVRNSNSIHIGTYFIND